WSGRDSSRAIGASCCATEPRNAGRSEARRAPMAGPGASDRAAMRPRRARLRHSGETEEMAEGDTLARIAVGLRPHLAGRVVVAARARLPGPPVSRGVRHRNCAAEALGKNLLIRFANGLEIRTHLGLHGSWHRYRPGEAWRRPASRAVLILEVQNAVAVCFDAPVVELFETRSEPVHPSLGQL